MKKVILFPENNECKIIKNALEKLDTYKVLYDENDSSADIIVFCDNIQNISWDIYKEKIKWAEKYNMQIILSDSIYKYLNIDVANYTLPKENLPDVKDMNLFYELPIPVILVMGQGKNCDKFSVQLKLVQCFTAYGYKTSLLSSNSLAKFFHYDKLPNFLYDEEISFEKKIIMFNHFLYEYVKNNQPDVLVIGCPGGIMEINEFEKNHFAEIPLIINSSVKADIGILCLYSYPHIPTMYFEKMKLLTEYKYDIEVDYFCISNQEYRSNSETQEIDYLFLNANNDMKQYENLKNVYATNNISIEAITEDIIKQLSDIPNII